MRNNIRNTLAGLLLGIAVLDEPAKAVICDGVNSPRPSPVYYIPQPTYSNQPNNLTDAEALFFG